MSDVGVIITSEDYRKTRSRVVLDYTSRDFAAIRAQLVGLAKGFMPEWETVGEANDFGTLLLELYSYMGDVMHYYIDRTASEAFLGTALRRQSVLYIADMLGYKPIGQQAASVMLQFTLDDRAPQAVNPNNPDPAYKVVLPAGTRVTNTANSTDAQIIFETDSEITLYPDNQVVEVYATEGVLVSDQNMGISKGVPNSSFLVPDRGVINGTLSLKTREGGNIVEWTYISDIALARPTQSAYTSFLDDDGRTYLLFGDNASGRIPPYGAEMYVTYRYGVGAAANDLAVGALSTLIPPADIEAWGISVTNGASPIGGSDPETVESMRYSIPRAAGRLKSRAVTLNDYSDLALQVPGVAKSIAYGTLYTAVYVRVAPVGGQATDDYMSSLIASVEAHLSDKVLVGTKIYAEPSNVDDLWTDAYLRITIHVQPAYNRTLVRQAVESSVRNLFAFDNVDFGGRVSLGQVYRAVLGVSGVEWAEIKWLDTTPPGSSQEIDLESSNDISRGHINDITPGDTTIARIDPTEVVEDAGVWSNYTLDERTHDGLWVKADGGLVGT